VRCAGSSRRLALQVSDRCPGRRSLIMLVAAPRLGRRTIAFEICQAHANEEVQTGRMDRYTALDAIDLESGRFLFVASKGGPSLGAPVPNCPGWHVAQLVQHLGFIYGRLALVVSLGRTEAPDRSEIPAAPAGDAVLGWFAEQRTEMLTALGAANEESVVWNWTDNSPGPTSFWFRRMAHETLIHRVDIELAEGDEATPGDPEVSADTVTEFFEIFYPRFENQPLATSIGGSLHLHATDISDAEWTIDPGRGSESLSRQHAKADVALRGDAFDLACWTWGRLPTERLEVFGDPEIAKRFQEVLRA